MALFATVTQYFPYIQLSCLESKSKLQDFNWSLKTWIKNVFIYIYLHHLKAILPIFIFWTYKVNFN